MGSKNFRDLSDKFKRFNQNAVRLLDQAREINRKIKDNPGCPENAARLQKIIELEKLAFAESRKARALIARSFK